MASTFTMEDRNFIARTIVTVNDEPANVSNHTQVIIQASKLFMYGLFMAKENSTEKSQKC